jgi:hypothetical protein
MTYADARMHGAVLAGWLTHRVELLNVVRKDDAGDRALDLRNPHGAINEVADLLGRRRHVDVLVRDIIEERNEVDLLLVMTAQGRAGLLSDDGDNRLMVQFGVEQSVEQVDRAGPGGRKPDTDFAGELRVRARHERRHLLVPYLREANPILRAIECTENAFDAIARVAVNPGDAPRESRSSRKSEVVAILAYVPKPRSGAGSSPRRFRNRWREDVGSLDSRARERGSCST